MSKYHIITYSPDSGEDDGLDYDTLKEAIKEARKIMSDRYYENVKIFHNHRVVREYVRNYNNRIINLIK